MRLQISSRKPKRELLLLISIADDGCGMRGNFLAALVTEGHYGLLGISERVALLGGRLQVQNQPSGGVLLEAEIQHPRVKALPWLAVPPMG